MFASCFILISGCTSSKWTHVPIDKQYDFILAYEQLKTSSSGQDVYAHPSKIETNVLENILANITYETQSGIMKKTKTTQVFQEAEIDKLAPLLADSLANALPDQRVRFASFNQGKGALFSQSQKTEGVIFVDSDNQLNIAFNYINANRQSSETSAIYHKFSMVDPLTIDSSDTQVVPSSPYVAARGHGQDQMFPMWILVNLNDLESPTTQKIEAELKSNTDTSMQEKPKLENIDAEPATFKQPSKSEKNDFNHDPAEPLSSPSPSDHTITDPIPSTTATEITYEVEIKEKLKFLRELYDEGLISEEEYAQKKLDILESL
jgi:hypothetical protein